MWGGLRLTNPFGSGPLGLRPDQATQLKTWIGCASEPSTWQLAYKGSRDGFAAAAFHTACDGKARLLVLVHEKEAGWIFGGFTSVGFKAGNPGYVPDPGAFLFSLHNREGHVTKYAPKAGSQIYCHSSHTATFGNNHDLYIASNADSTVGSYTNIGAGYELTGTGGPHVLSGGIRQGWLIAEFTAYVVPA